MKYVFLFFACITFLLAACSGSESSEPAIPAEIVQQEAEIEAVVNTAVPTHTAIPATTTTERPTTEARSTETAVAPPTEPPTPTPPLAVTTEPAIEVVSGQLPDGAFFFGDVNAPLTVIDYSDFL